MGLCVGTGRRGSGRVRRRCVVFKGMSQGRDRPGMNAREAPSAAVACIALVVTMWFPCYVACGRVLAKNKLRGTIPAKLGKCTQMEKM